MYRLLIPLTLTGLLGACELHGKTPYVEFDKFMTVTKVSEPQKPVKIITVAKPLPLPGQLKKRPVKKTKAALAAKNKVPVKQRIKDAHNKARIEPTSDGYINAVQVYPFTQGALYRLYGAVNQVSDIALQPGEHLKSVSAGDTVRWIVGDAKSGSGTTQQVHILVKPVASDLQTNLVIHTDRRSYHLELISDDSTYMSSLSWTYPGEALVTLKRANQSAQTRADRLVARDVKVENLKFRYVIKGKAAWKPERVFDDGRKVYIKFPDSITQGAAPPLFILGNKGKLMLINYRMKHPYYIVDHLFAVAELRHGEDPQSVVRITRQDTVWK
ncbi:MAG: P-type conjugative transfer protein TrbG [Methyloligellaceae bacterium]